MTVVAVPVVGLIGRLVHDAGLGGARLQPWKGETKRALIVTRLSRATEAATSPERQMEICQGLCASTAIRRVATLSRVLDTEHGPA
ncbi:hypothetical protein RA989_19185 [Mycobacteroides abscessus subsp. massiliense]